MKKIIVTSILILTIVYITLSVLGSGGEYAAEKLFYRAIKIIGKIAANPDVAPPALINSAENGLKLVIKKYPNSNSAKSAYLTLAQFYASRKKYDNAISTLNEVINLKINDEITLSKAHFLKGNVYEKSGKWDSALKEYRILEDKYTYTELGIQAPLYVGNYYLSNEKEEAANKALNEAVVFYQKIRDEKKKAVAGYVASNLLTQTYLNLKRFEDAGKIVEDIITDYPSEQVYTQYLPSVELIFVKNLNKKDKAIEIYNGIKEKTKNNKLKKLLEDRIKVLRAKK